MVRTLRKGTQEGEDTGWSSVRPGGLGLSLFCVSTYKMVWYFVNSLLAKIAVVVVTVNPVSILNT